MFKIGDFAKLSQVSVKALRHYDDLDLLKPASVDRFTGHRYYAANQLPRLNRILALKDLGFSLEQIRQLLGEELPVEQLRGMLRLRQAEIEQNVEVEQARLVRVEARLRQIEQEGQMPAHEIALKKVEAKKVASVREVIPQYAEVGRLIGEVFAYPGQQGIRSLGPPTVIYHFTPTVHLRPAIGRPSVLQDYVVGATLDDAGRGD
jgi:DNA-binding transcriptional MerR regulator